QAQYPLPYKTASSLTPPPNAALYPSIGWVAMHSNMQDPNRTSLYFKSSPYGAYNHSHGDQNSIILNSGNRPLLIEAGYMDYYGSPLFHDWYRTTKAHNAVTFDNGIGQMITGNTVNLSRNGKITSFSTSPQLDYVEGDATAAYGGTLTSAVRKVWYLRPLDAAIVQDKVSAPIARAWEWNLHAAAPINKAADGSVSIVNVDRSVCVRPLLNASALNYQVRTGPAPKAGMVEVHGAFVAPASKAGEFIMLLDVGCKNPAVTMTETATSRTFTVGGQAVTMPK
ncbi:MAG TPA: heparinase II/III family protein, partial [Telluria sp.]